MNWKSIRKTKTALMEENTATFIFLDKSKKKNQLMKRERTIKG
jgi:hypothetical protein